MAYVILLSMTGKIINFQQRRQLEQAIAELARTGNELELVEAARQIVHRFPAETVLAALLKHLDTADSQLRGGLGHVAALLPSDEAAAALRSAAANRQQPPLARMTAAAIAQRFLGVELPAALTQDIRGDDDAAFQSLQEAIGEGKRNRHVLLEYVEQMRQMDEEIAFLVLDALQRLPPPDRVELLRLIAQDLRPRVASAALSALEGLAGGEASAAALRSLYTLQFVLPQELRAQADRSLRKLRMAGRSYTPPSPAGWRALLSPADPNGVQTIWLLRMPEGNAQLGALLGFSLNMELGILRFFGSETVDRTALPDRQPAGSLVTVRNDGGATMVLVETPFDVGRWLVSQVGNAHLAGEPRQPLPPEYQLYNDVLWEFAPPVVDDTITSIWSAAAAPVLPEPASLQRDTQVIFAQPAMAHWEVQSNAILQALPVAARPAPDLPLAERVAALVRAISQWPESAALPPALARGLRGQALWFQITGQPQLAQQAKTLAGVLPRLPLTENPVLAHMLAASLQRKNKNGKS
jgi:hypothetical protein